VVDEERPRTSWLGDVLRTWLPAILAVLAIRTYVFEPFRIPSGSMAPTLQIGDHVVVNKGSYGLWVPLTGIEIPYMEVLWVVPRLELLDWGNPRAGDVIVFRYPADESVNYIKRVVAVPGDTIRVNNNQVFVDGVAQERVVTDRYDSIDESCRARPTKRYVEDLGGFEHHVLTNQGISGQLSNWPRDGEPVTVPEGHVFVMGDNRDNSEDSRRWGFVRYDQIKGKAHFVWFSWDGCASKIRTHRFFRSLYALYDD
jgi:signal peptidase I